MLIERLCVIGVGLIGGSLARALKRAEVVGEVIGAGRSEHNLAKAQQLGVVDHYTLSLGEAVSTADMVVVAVPLGSIYKIFAVIADHLPADCVLTDVGSSKTSVVEEARRVFGRIPENFVPGHPIAGTEHSGVEASVAELFERRRVILTPLAETQPWARHKVRAMWEATGAEVVDMGVRHHDDVLAATSHLPHMLAYTLVDCLARMDHRTDIFRYAAGGFRDFTRIASSDPTMWHDVCVANRESLLSVLQQFSDELNQLAAAIEAGDSKTLFDIFQRAKQARDNLYLE